MAKFINVDSLKKTKTAKKKDIKRHPLAELSREVKLAYLGGLCFFAVGDDGEFQEKEKALVLEYAQALGIADSDANETIETILGLTDKLGYLKEVLPHVGELRTAQFFFCDAARVMSADHPATSDGWELFNEILSLLDLSEVQAKFITVISKYIVGQIRLADVDVLDGFDAEKDGLTKEVLDWFAPELIPQLVNAENIPASIEKGIFIVQLGITLSRDKYQSSMIKSARFVFRNGAGAIYFDLDNIDIEDASFVAVNEKELLEKPDCRIFRYFACVQAGQVKFRRCSFKCGHTRNTVLKDGGEVSFEDCAVTDLDDNFSSAAMLSSVTMLGQYGNGGNGQRRNIGGSYFGSFEMNGGVYDISSSPLWLHHSGVCRFDNMEFHFRGALGHIVFDHCHEAIFENCKFITEDVCHLDSYSLLKDDSSAEDLKLCLRNCTFECQTKPDTENLQDYIYSDEPIKIMISNNDPTSMCVVDISGSLYASDCKFVNFKCFSKDRAVINAENPYMTSKISLTRCTFVNCLSSRNYTIFGQSLEMNQCTIQNCEGKFGVVGFKRGCCFSLCYTKFLGCKVNNNYYFINASNTDGNPPSHGLGVESSCAENCQVYNNQWVCPGIKVNWRSVADVDALRNQVMA